jgi:hypothetical protein
MTSREILRRMVLESRDGYSEPIRFFLQIHGAKQISDTRVDSNMLTVFIGGDGEGPVPEDGATLMREFGGRVMSDSTPGDRFYRWGWIAGMSEERE